MQRKEQDFLLKKYQICFGVKFKKGDFIEKNKICFVNKKN